MKRFVLILILLPILASCGNFRHSNFSKQKFTKLKQVEKTYNNEEVKEEQSLDLTFEVEDTLVEECDSLYFKSGKIVSCTILKENDEIIEFDNCPPTGAYYRVKKEKLVGYEIPEVVVETSMDSSQILEDTVQSEISEPTVVTTEVDSDKQKEISDYQQKTLKKFDNLFIVGLTFFLLGILLSGFFPLIGVGLLFISWVIALSMMTVSRKNKEWLAEKSHMFKLKNTLAWLWGIGLIVGVVIGIGITLAIIISFL